MGRYLVGQDPNRVIFHWQAIHRGSFYRGGPIKTAIVSGIDQALWDIKGKIYGVPVYKPLRRSRPATASESTAKSVRRLA